MKTPKVLFLLKSIDGGTGTFASAILKLKGQNLDISPLVLEKPHYRTLEGTDFNYFKRDYPDNYSLSLSNFLSFIKEIFWIKRKIERQNPDVLFGVDIHSNLIILINKFLFNKKLRVIITTHTGIKETLLEKATPAARPFLKNFLSFFYKKADIHICVSNHISRSITNTLTLSKRPSVIHNGIKKRSKIKITPLGKSPTFINIARLTKQKDHKTLIKAFGGVKKKIPEAKLSIVGEGPLKKELITYTKVEKISGVEFLGWKNDTTNLMKKANIFVLSSEREGFPFSLLEAMSFGKAVVATDTPHGPKEILKDNKYGLLSPVGSAGKLKNNMLKLAKDAKTYKKYAKKALERSRNFTEEKMLKEYRKVIDESIN